MIRIRSADIPRITGLPMVGPQFENETPGVPSSVSAKLLFLLISSSCPFKTDIGTINSSELTPKGFAVTGVVGKSIF